LRGFQDVAQSIPEQTSLEIDHSEVSFINDEKVTVEKKVKLPMAWIKGFASIPYLTSQSTKVAELKGPAIAQFFHTIPDRSDRNASYWFTSGLRGAKLSRTKVPGSFLVRSPERLKDLGAIAHLAKKLSVYEMNQKQMSIWTMELEETQLTVALSAEIWRGFSGEGAGIQELFNTGDPLLGEELLPEMESPISASKLAYQTELSISEVNSNLALLSAQGLIGFDHSTNEWFQRFLPYSEILINKTNPRLKTAEKIIMEGGVQITKKTDRLHRRNERRHCTMHMLLAC